MASFSRVACLFVPDLPLQALYRAEPDLRGARVALMDGTGLGRVLHVAPEALGVRSGMTGSQARAICSGLTVRVLAEGIVCSAVDALYDLGMSFSPVVERREDGVHLEVGDLGRLFDSEHGLATALSAQACKLDLDVHVALTASAPTARVFARARPGVHVVPPGAERAELSPLPLSALEPSAALAERLGQWGLRTAGDFAALPRRSLASRLGPEGVALHRLACGEDRTPLRPTPPPDSVCEALDLDDPLDNLEPLSFLLRGLLDRLVTRLGLRSLACERYVLRLALDPKGHEERTITVAAPTRDVPTLLELARLALSAHPPAAPVCKLSVLTTPVPRRSIQLSLFEPAGPAPEALSTTIARLDALCGPGRVGIPAVLDSYLPGQAHLISFPEGQPLSARSPLPCGPPGLSLAIFRPPERAEVLLQDRAPDFLHSAPVTGPILNFAGPSRVRIGFQTPVLHDYYDVETEGGRLYRIYEDLASGSWFVDARYE